MPTKAKQRKSPQRRVPARPATNGSVDPDRLYTYEEIAELCGMSVYSVKRWTFTGKLGCTIIPGGRARRIRGQQYLDALEAGARDPDLGGG